MDAYFARHNVTEDWRVAIAISKLKGASGLWWSTVEERLKIRTWARLKIRFLSRCQPMSMERMRIMVEVYAKEFRNMSLKQKQKPIGVHLRARMMSYLWYAYFAYVVLPKDQQFMLCPSYYQNHTISGCFSERASELAVLLPSEFNEVFDNTFGHHMGGFEADCCNCPAETAFNSNLSEGGSMSYPNSPIADDN